MGINKQPNAKGVDKPIQAFQSALYTHLKKLWNIQDADWNCWDRAYRNQSDDGAYYPEVFIGGTQDVARSQDYKEVFFDDTVKLVTFFGLGEEITYKVASATAPVYLIFCISDLTALKPDRINRADEEVRNDVQRFCATNRSGFFMSAFLLGLDNVFREYSGWRKTEGIRNRDMHPFHCFRINFNVIYNIQSC